MSKLSPKMIDLLEWFKENKSLSVTKWGGKAMSSLPAKATLI